MSDRTPLKLDDQALAQIVGRTCKACRHWHMIGKPQVRGPVVLTGQVPAEVGECRRKLVTLMVPNGQCISLYPQTAGAFPACGDYAPGQNGEA